MAPLTTPTPAYAHGTNVTGLQTAQEVLDAAGLNWTVSKKPLVAHLTLDDGTILDMPVKGKFTIDRDDNHAVLGIVGKNFRAVPPTENTALLDSLAEDLLAKFEYAGSEGQGERVWFKVKLPKEIRIKDNPDEVVSFSMFLSNAFNGTKSLVMHFTPELDKQATILNPSVMKSDTMSIRHTKKYDEHIKEVRKVLRLAEQYFDSCSEMFNGLADITMDSSKYDEVMNTIMPIPPPDPITGEAPNAHRAETAREKLSQLITEQDTLSHFPKTAWAAFVAISNYADHEKSFKSRKDEAGSRDSIRFLSILEGDSQDMKNEALEILLKQ